MADQQPKALRLAEWLQSGADDPMWSDHTEMPKSVAAHAAAELRRLHSVNAQLLEALNDIARQPEGDEESAQTVARAAIRARGSA